MKKVLSTILSLAMVFAMSVTAFAATPEDTNALKSGTATVANEACEMLDTMPTTQTIATTEREMIEGMLEDGSITRADLNQEFSELAQEPVDELQEKGYTDTQISIITSYEEGEDAFNHIFNPNPYTRAAAQSGAEVTFRYGLAGSNTRKSLTIAYDMMWSECPMFTFTDSFGIGWITADSGSYEIVTKTDSAAAQVQYYDPSTETYANLYRDVTMDKSENGVVVGTPIMGSASGNYGKHISGVTKVSTQSGSYNIDTIHLFVAYAHTTLAFTFDWEVMLEWEKVSAAISFIPRPRQEIIAQGDHTFRYNSQSVITADNV